MKDWSVPVYRKVRLDVCPAASGSSDARATAARARIVVPRSALCDDSRARPAAARGHHKAQALAAPARDGKSQGQNGVGRGTGEPLSISGGAEP
eukprot:COSAG06_NODE_7843_length_2356_cov_1.262295_3_plen_93_part_01